MPYDSSPWVGELEPGRKAFCACGNSKNKPYCDGSHNKAECDKSPTVCEIPSAKNYAICMCGKSGDKPFCDGSHNV